MHFGIVCIKHGAQHFCHVGCFANIHDLRPATVDKSISSGCCAASFIGCVRIPAMEKVILASNSPRRKELFSLFGWPFEVIPANLDETRLPFEPPETYVRRLATQKAGEIAAQENGLVIAADTVVVDGDELLGKPSDEADARCMLRKLRSRSHQVYTGIAMMDSVSGRKYAAVCQTDVPMRDYSDLEIETYISTGDPMDKAGAYAIQHAGFHPVEGLVGCFASVMGFPLCHIVVGLHALGFDVPEDIPEKCQKLLNYSCPVFNRILGKV